jgi:hypothetical protein
MWLWGLNVARFVHPFAAAALLLPFAVLLFPRFARALVPAARWLGDAVSSHPGKAAAIVAIAAGTLVWALPDRLLFTGDLLLRQGTVGLNKDPALIFPQALPLDLLLHVRLPRLWIEHIGLPTNQAANQAARIIGAGEAALLGVLALSFARALGLTGVASLSAAAVVFFGGYVGLFSGYNKAFADLCLIIVAVGAWGTRAVREGGGLLPMSLAVAVALGLHRLGLALLPITLMVWVLWWKHHSAGGAWRRLSVIAAGGVLVTGMLLFMPKIIEAMRVRDAAHFAPAATRRLGVIGAAFAGLRPLDLTNVAMLLCPLAPVIPFLALTLRRKPIERREMWVLLALALPFVLLMPFVHPGQGIFRDWDIYAPMGATLALVAAWLVSETVRSREQGPLAIAVVVTMMMGGLHWLLHLSDAGRSLERVEAFVHESPARYGDEAATTWDFIGGRYLALQRWDDAARAYELASNAAPNPRFILEWGTAETMRGHHRQAQSLYARAAALNPNFTLAWLGVASASTHLADTAECARAERNIERLDPNHPQLPAIRDYLARMRAYQAGRGGR